jgi:DNA polymerase III, alpha subunit (gram-positive type)
MSVLDDFLDQTIYVLDTETTGLNGYPNDLVVDIAICRVDPGKGTVQNVYSSVVGYDTSNWTDGMRNSWIFLNTDLTVDAVSEAPDAKKVAADVLRILKGKNVTAFNKEFDLNKFLYYEPWNLRNNIMESDCIMLAAKNVCKLPGLYDDYKWPRLEQAYSMIVPGDPAGIDGTQTHRALSDAVMASYVLIEMHRNGQYPRKRSF